MFVFAVIVVVVFLAFSGVAVYFMIRNISRIKKNDEIHFSGGVDINRGYISYDNNFFKGIESIGNEKTTSVKQPEFQSERVTLYRKSDGKFFYLPLKTELVIGRSTSDSVYGIPDDLTISKRHCRLMRYNGLLYIEDLNSSNHTFVNGTKISSPVPIKRGDIVRIGNTELCFAQ